MDEAMQDQSPPQDDRHGSPRPFDNPAPSPSVLAIASRLPSRRAARQVNRDTEEFTSRPRRISEESRSEDESERISSCPTTPELSPEPGIVIEVPPYITPTGTYEQDSLYVDVQSEDAEAEYKAKYESEYEAEAGSEAKSEPEQVVYTRPRSERIKKRAMIESNSPDRPTEEPSTKRTKDGPVDVHTLQNSLYEPLGKTYPFFSTPVPGPPKLPQAAQDWLNQVIQQDPQTGRICYAHTPLLRPFNENHLVVLRAAFDANKDRLDVLKESFFEFTSAMAGCSAAQVRAWFSDQAMEHETKRQKEQRKQARLQKQRKQMQKQTRKRQKQQKDRDTRRLGRPQGHEGPARDRDQFRLDRHRMRLENRPRNKQNPRARYVLPPDAPALERTKHVSRVYIPEERQVLQASRCSKFVLSKRGIPLAWTQCRACVTRQVGDVCSFSNFRLFEVVSIQDKDDPSKYLANHDFYSDPSQDEAICFNVEGLTQSDAEYILAYVGHFGKRMLKEELHAALGEKSDRNSNKSSKATKTSSLGEYLRRPVPVRRFCYMCRASIVSYGHFCTSCGIEVCTHCLTHDNGTVFCHEKAKHSQEQFIVCGRYHAETLKAMLQSVEGAMEALPRNLHLVSDRMAAKAAQERRKSKRGSFSSFKSGSQGASLPVPLRVSKDLSQAEFQQHWVKGRILVFTDLQFIKRSVWSPHNLKGLSGTASVSVYDAVKQTVTMEPMTTFFDRGFVGPDSTSIRIIEAWPEKTLMEEAPRLYADLIKTLPVPMYTHPTGSYNLSKYLPSDWIAQGPKLHIGEGSTDKNVGSIRLSVENSDVLYACVYAERRERAIAKGDEAVVWDIFQAEDRKKVEYFMRQFVGKKAAPPKRCVDPFQDIVPYLKPEVLSLLHKATGVKATRVALKVDEAIMIPAGCLRQAQFVQNAVTVEVDFVSPERLWATIDWCHEKQEYAFSRPKSKTRRTDIFPAHDVAFYSSLAMAQS
ncbi:putative JmjC domain-containing histone demethylation protein 2C [Podila clonocystis]|nr:putative JmjC domain-containing histone demethylation protein 2C [Podila clonocystis]